MPIFRAAAEVTRANVMISSRFTLGSDWCRHQTLFRDSRIFAGDWRTAYSAFSGSADCVAWPHRLDSAPLIDGGGALAPSLIVATDTAFSSNRFAWTHQIHKLDL